MLAEVWGSHTIDTYSSTGLTIRQYLGLQIPVDKGVDLVSFFGDWLNLVIKGKLSVDSDY